MSCNGCLITEKEKQHNIESVSKDAKEYAVRNKTFVVVYLLADGKASFMEAEAARSNGVIPVKFVSYLQQTSDG